MFAVQSIRKISLCIRPAVTELNQILSSHVVVNEILSALDPFLRVVLPSLVPSDVSVRMCSKDLFAISVNGPKSCNLRWFDAGLFVRFCEFLARIVRIGYGFLPHQCGKHQERNQVAQQRQRSTAQGGM